MMMPPNPNAPPAHPAPPHGGPPPPPGKLFFMFCPGCSGLFRDNLIIKHFAFVYHLPGQGNSIHYIQFCICFIKKVYFFPKCEIKP